MYFYIFEVKYNNCYDVKTGHRYNVDIFTNIYSVAVFTRAT